MDGQSSRVRGWLAVLLAFLWAETLFSVWKDRGLFDWLGIDYALYASGAKLLFSGRPTAIYDPEAVAQALRPFLAYYGPRADAYVKVGPLPHPAPSFLLYAPFAALEPSWGFLAWAVVNLMLALTVVRGLAGRFPDRHWSLTVLGLTAFPLVLYFPRLPLSEPLTRCA